jgi:CRISPR/Cas system-associated exonuclease Cas4 (RecB family)
MIAGFICEKTQDKIPFQDCLDCARTRVNRKLDCPFDEATINGMIMSESKREGISVTMISGCPRGTFINKHYAVSVRPSDMYWAFRGQIAHKILEAANLHPDAIKEKRFFKVWEGIEISGQPDLIVPSQKVLKDYKTTKAVPTYVNKDGVILAYENHRVQLNLYRWLIPHEIEEMEVVYFSMEETLISPVEIWPDQSTRKTEMTVDRYLEENLVPLKMALDSETMPPYKRNWACDEYCGVADICYRELKKEILATRRVITLKKGDNNHVSPHSDKKRLRSIS